MTSKPGPMLADEQGARMVKVSILSQSQCARTHRYPNGRSKEYDGNGRKRDRVSEQIVYSRAEIFRI